jgi:ubiquinone/menaquinone biosynthesis C-methylase UbiE
VAEANRAALGPPALRLTEDASADPREIPSLDGSILRRKRAKPSYRGPMDRGIREGELLLAAEGAALFRHLFDTDEAFRERRLGAMRELLGALDGDGPLGEPRGIPELDVHAGYAAWAPSYDSVSNAAIRAEEELVHAVLKSIRPGRALDAACGTGRHAAHLVGLGHDVVGIDRSPAMLSVARNKVPTARFARGDLTQLSIGDASMDLAACGLSLTHLPELAPAIGELARVLRPGGHLVLSDVHPTFVMLQGQAVFRQEEGYAFIRNHVHLHGHYLEAFSRAGLAVLACLEAPMRADHDVGLLGGAAEAAAAVFDDVPAVLVWSLERTRPSAVMAGQREAGRALPAKAPGGPDADPEGLGAP